MLDDPRELKMGNIVPKGFYSSKAKSVIFVHNEVKSKLLIKLIMGKWFHKAWGWLVNVLQ